MAVIKQIGERRHVSLHDLLEGKLGAVIDTATGELIAEDKRTEAEKQEHPERVFFV